MKTLKFRVWNETAKMVEPHMVYLDPQKQECFDGCDLVSEDGWTVMQFTGLLDKFGKEIYEGDVVEYETTGGNECGEIRYVPKLTAYYIFYRKAEPEQLSSVEDGIVPILEVIGNVYQNPDLLATPPNYSARRRAQLSK